jgi:hypothetical protein
MERKGRASAGGDSDLNIHFVEFRPLIFHIMSLHDYPPVGFIP